MTMIISPPITSTTIVEIVSFDIDDVKITLFEKVWISIIINTNSAFNYRRNFELTGDDYTNWNNDDQYIIDYISTNIQAIFNA